MMFKIIILLCSTVINSDYCSVHNAVAVWRAPNHSTMYEGKCDDHGKKLAEKALKMVDGKKFYIRWECIPIEDDRGS